MIESFKLKNIKLTKQRKLVFETIEKLEEAKIKDILKICGKEMNNSTIYRIIDLFLKKEIITKNLDNSNSLIYSINKNEHKHYIYCIKCHNKQLIDICPIDSIKSAGYKLISHQIKIEGICNECQKK